MKNSIIIFIPSLEFGGAERVVTYLSDAMSLKYKVYVLTTKENDKEYSLNVNVERINISASNFFILVKRIRKIVLDIEPLYTITMFAPMYILIWIALIGTHIPQIVSERNDPRNFAGKYWVKKVYQKIIYRANGIVFQTEDAMKYYFKTKRINTKIIYNPIKKDELPKVYTGIRKKEIINVGRLHPQKNQKMLINVMVEIHEKYPEYILKIYGEGELRDELETLIKNKSAEKYIKLMGNSLNLLQEIRAATAFILTSDFEGMPNALIEAMCLGIPVISTDCPCGGPKELIQDKVNGILVPVNNQEYLKKAIILLLSDKELCEKMSCNAYKLRYELDVDVIVNMWDEFCISVSNKGKK